MDESTARQLLLSEIALLIAEVSDRSPSGSPALPSIENISNFALSDLEKFKRELRDLIRTLGGLK